MTRRIAVLVALAAVALLAAPALVEAAGPALTATVIPGQEIDLVGSGYPADADVQLAIRRNGVDAGSQALHTDADGSFSATIDAGPGRGGVYTLTATSGSAIATVEALAVETAGGLPFAPPPTDAVPSSASHDGIADRTAELALVGVALSVAVSALRRRAGEAGRQP